MIKPSDEPLRKGETQISTFCAVRVFIGRILVDYEQSIDQYAHKKLWGPRVTTLQH